MSGSQVYNSPMIACRIDVTTRNGSVVASVAILDNSTGSLQKRVEAACAKLRRDYPTSTLLRYHLATRGSGRS